MGNGSHQESERKIAKGSHYLLPRPYPLEWLCLFCGVFLSFYYSWIMDDAYIYFRYVDNLVFLRYGLVYNAGEFVEGFSSPVWTLLLALLRFLQLNYWTIIRLISILSYVVFWALLVIVNRKLTEHNAESYVLNFPLIHLTFTYGVLSYFSSGMETPLIQISAVAYACLLLFPNSKLFQIMVGLTPFIRPELGISYVIVFLFLLMTKRRFPWALFITCAMTLGGWLFFRIYYYADFFPNTFHLKDEISLKQGIYYVYDTVLPYFSVHIILFFVLYYVFMMRKDRRFDAYGLERVLMLVISLSVASYVVRIGGDARHFRYLAFSYCIAVTSTGGLLERLVSQLGLEKHRRFVVMFSLIIICFTFMCYPRQLLHHPIFRDIGYSHSQFLNIEDAAGHRMNKSWTPSLLSKGSEIEMKREMKAYKTDGGSIPLENVISTARCARAYKMFDYYNIHSLALTEPFLARTNMFSNRPGHKDGLVPLARDIVEIRKSYGFGRGSFEKAVIDAKAPDWVARNLEVIKAVELKAYNNHRFWKNLSHASKGTGRIEPRSRVTDVQGEKGE